MLLGRRGDVLLFLVETGVLECKRHGGAELAGEVDLGVVERAGLLSVEEEAADDARPSKQGHGELRAQPVRAHEADVELRLGLDVDDGACCPFFSTDVATGASASPRRRPEATSSNPRW